MIFQTVFQMGENGVFKVFEHLFVSLTPGVASLKLRRKGEAIFLIPIRFLFPDFHRQAEKGLEKASLGERCELVFAPLTLYNIPYEAC